VQLAPLVVALMTALSVGRSPPAPPEPVLKRTVTLTEVSGRIDHMAYDPATERLYVAALGNGSLEAVDLKKGERIKSVKGLDEPQGLVFVPATNQVVVACGGDGTVRAYDGATLEERVKVDLGADADNLRLGVDGKSIVVGYGDGAVAELDAATLHKTADVKLDGHPESFQLEPTGASGGAGRVFVNIPGGFIGGGGSVAVVDRGAKKVTATWPLKEAGRNFPMALDAANKRLYVGCRRGAKLLVLDTDTGAVLASPQCVGDADDVFVDPKSGRVVVVGGDGLVDVFETADHKTYTKAASVQTASGARTGLLVPERRALLVAVPARSGHAAEIREYALPD
jgi:DNA-binding beta-propeller fold protein YncE